MFMTLILPRYDEMGTRWDVVNSLDSQVNHVVIARQNNEDSTYPRAKSM